MTNERQRCAIEITESRRMVPVRIGGRDLKPVEVITMVTRFPLVPVKVITTVARPLPPVKVITTVTRYALPPVKVETIA